LSGDGTNPHPACALFTIEKPATLSTSAASKGRIEIFMALPLEIVERGLLSTRSEKHAPYPRKVHYSRVKCCTAPE
jgi:hypothetical protein